MEEQNRVNEEKNSNTQRQETGEVAKREKVGEEDGKTRRDCHQTKTSGGKGHPRKRGTKKND